MAGHLRFLQANGNHCAGAQDLFLQSMVEWAVDVAVMSEPYYVPAQPHWVGDADGSVAIVTRPGAVPPLAVKARGHGYVAAVRGEIALVGSTAWGNPHTTPKGRELEEWALTAGLSLLNTGTVQTCVRRSGGSVVDVSFATPTIARRVEGWRVEAGVETLSDHCYIRFEVSFTPAGRRSPTSSSSSPRERSRFPRWALSKLNRELAEEAAVVGRWSLPESAELGVDEGASRFGDVLQNVCRAAMPPVGRPPPRGAVYWWSENISNLRVACNGARRAYTRTWLELVEGLDRDPWGRPYKRARNKLCAQSAPITEVLQPAVLRGIVGELFPDAPAGFTPPRMARLTTWRKARARDCQSPNLGSEPVGRPSMPSNA
ncbi:uncharacterized protein LOC133319550 [Danaus plexippus]|uniref:uncharacterized protein LOC133319550 n=1 Tax=Danaus plexippus TaxID=13037 RepID=UPI002AB1F6B9|nr:uncharacterized protein LOC133319550 [Danaus plexippus]